MRQKINMGLLPMFFLSIGWISFSLSWLAPGHYPPWPAFQSQALACFGLVLLGASTITAPKAFKVAIPPSAWAVVSLAVVLLLQWGYRIDHFIQDAAIPSTWMVMFAVAIVVGATWRQKGQEALICPLLIIFLSAASISVALQLMQWQSINLVGIFLTDLPLGGRPYANLAQPNHLATLLALGLAGVWLLNRQQILTCSTAVVLAVWLLGGVVMTQSRTGIVAVVMLCLVYTYQLKIGPWKWLLSAMLILMFIGAAALWYPLNDALFLSGTKPLTLERLQAGSRAEYWPALWKAMWWHPIEGWGWNQVAMAQQAMGRSGSAGHELLFSSHNIFLDIGLQAGVPVLLVVLWATTRWSWRRVRRATGPEVIALSSLGVIGIHSFTEYPLEYAYFLVPFGLLVGALDQPPVDRSDARVDPSNGTPSRHVYVFATLLVGTACMLGWLCSDYLRIERFDRDARMALAGIGDPASRNVAVPDVVLLDGLREYQRFRLTPAHSDMTSKDLDWMRAVVNRYPYAPALLRLALAESLNGRPEEGSQVLKALCHTQEPLRCDEARQSWASAAMQYGVLPAFPEVEEASAWWRYWTSP